MGKIKTKLVKRTAETLIEKDIPFSESFENNKRILGNTMPSKKIRNQIAGMIARTKRREMEKKQESAPRMSE
jgi:ribosomal protein S17E